ncbi:thiol peroxidase [Thermosulfurimonas dismutans]
MQALMKKLKGLEERPGLVTFQGQPLTLLGPEIKPGLKAPDFTVVDKDLKPVNLSDFKDQILVISVTPSLDTPVCDLQARRFNQEAAGLSDKVAVINISMDLPFAIARFCTQAGIDRVYALSDYQEASFGRNYGVLIKELRLLSRAVFVIDSNGLVRYVEIVPEITQEPDYEKALSVVKELK